MMKRLSMLSLVLFSAVAVCGQFTWRRTYGGFDANVGMSVDLTADGGYVVAGSTGSFGFGGQAYVIKLDELGLPQWSRNIGDGAVQNGIACRTLPDGYILVGSNSSGVSGGYDIYLVRLNLEGQVLWERSIGTSAWDFGMDVEPLDDGYAITGTTFVSGSSDVIIVRTDLDGVEIWRQFFGGDGDDSGRSVTHTSSGDLIITGALSVPQDEGRSDAFVARLTGDGATSWMTTFGGDSVDYFHDAVELLDGAIVCSGGTQSYGDVKRILLVKVDAEGNSIWQEMFGSMGDSEAREIQLTSDGNLAMASYNSYNNAGGRDMVLFIASGSGSFILGKNYGGLDNEEGVGVRCTADGGYVVVGTAEGYGPGITSIYVVKAGSDGETLDDTVYEMFDDTDVPSSSLVRPTSPPSPNPATTFTQLQGAGPWTMVHLTDAQGRMVRRWERPVAGRLDLQGLEPGRYQLVTFGEDGRQHAALIIAQH